MQTPDTFQLNFCFKLDPLWFSEETTTSIRTPPRNQGFYLTRSTRDQTANQLRKLIRHARESLNRSYHWRRFDIYIYIKLTSAVSNRNCSKAKRWKKKKKDKASMWRTREHVGARSDGEEGIESDRKKAENRQTKWRVLAGRSAKGVQRRGKEHEKGRFLPFQAVVDEIVEGARGKTNERKSERSEILRRTEEKKKMESEWKEWKGEEWMRLEWRQNGAERDA